MPNFAITRKRVSLEAENSDEDFGYDYIYNYPNDCLRILGIGNIKDKENNYTVENGKIYTSEKYDDGLPLRYVKDVSDVSAWDAPFKELVSWALAVNVCLSITQNEQKQQLVEQSYNNIKFNVLAMNGQENRPIRVSRSKFKASRFGGSYDVEKL
jgi:hypothetical protein